MPPLTRGTIIRRYQRFLADIRLGDGSVVVAHCPNTGSMKSCWRPGAPVQISHSTNPKRKLAWTLERVDMGNGWVGVNTSRVNGIIGFALEHHLLPQLPAYNQILGEPKITVDGFPASRFDFLLRRRDGPDIYVEVKNTTLIEGDRIMFPDAVTERGRKHLLLLAEMLELGHRALVLFALNRPEGACFSPAEHIDPQYAESLADVHRRGVEILLVRLRHTVNGVEIAGAMLV